MKIINTKHIHKNIKMISYGISKWKMIHYSNKFWKEKNKN